MSRICKILWLDDDFSIASNNFNMMNTHVRHVKEKLSKNNIEPIVEQCVYVNDFIARATEKANQWDVFIIDINGWRDEKASEKMEPKNLMYSICKETEKCNVLRFCLTGEPTLDPDKERNEELCRLLEDNNFIADNETELPYWWKAGRILEMAKSIIDYYNDEFGTYDDLRALCKFMTEEDKPYIRQLAQWKITNGEVEFPDHLSLRNALKDGVLTKALPEKFFCGADHNFNYFKEDSKTTLKEAAINDWLRYPISFLTVLNKNCHTNNKVNNQLLNEMIFNAVILFANYINEMAQKLNEDNLEEYVKSPINQIAQEQVAITDEHPKHNYTGTIACDKYQTMSIGDCAIAPVVLANYINRNYGGIEILEYSDNTFPKTKEIYKNTAKKIKIIKK